MTLAAALPNNPMNSSENRFCRLLLAYLLEAFNGFLIPFYSVYNTQMVYLESYYTVLTCNLNLNL